jgi:ribosomal protein L22
MLLALTKGFQTAVAARSSSKPKGSVSSLFDAVMSEAKEIQKNSPSKATASEPVSALKEARGNADAIKLPTFTTGRFKGSHRKVNHLTRLIQGMSLQEAHTQMSMNLKRPAENVVKMLHRVMAALRHNYNLDPARYYIQRAWVGKESHRKAINIHGRGRMGIITHPYSHVKITLGERDPNPSKEDKEVAQLAQIFRRTKPFIPLNETRPLQFAHPVWSSKPWKYVTSPKWIDSENALRKLEK